MALQLLWNCDTIMDFVMVIQKAMHFKTLSQMTTVQIHLNRFRLINMPQFWPQLWRITHFIWYCHIQYYILLDNVENSIQIRAFCIIHTLKRRGHQLNSFYSSYADVNYLCSTHWFTWASAQYQIHNVASIRIHYLKKKDNDK